MNNLRLFFTFNKFCVVRYRIHPFHILVSFCCPIRNYLVPGSTPLVIFKVTVHQRRFSFLEISYKFEHRILLSWIPRNYRRISEHRRALFQLLNGDIFYPVQVWPKKILTTFVKKPMGDQDTFQLVLSFLGNECFPDIISEWINSSQYWASSQKLDKRKRQVSLIYNNMTSKGHI